MKIERRHVKFIIGTAGLMGIYAGAFLGMGIFALQPASGFWMLTVESLLGLVGGIAAVIGTDRWLGRVASHVDWFKVPKYWLAAAAALYIADWIIEKTTPWALPPFVSNLALWIAGVLAVWVDEPKS